MEFILFIIAWLIGGFIGALTIGQGLLIALNGLPKAIRWYRGGWFTVPTPIFRYIFALIFLVVIFIISSWVVMKYFPDYATPYFIGVGIMFFFGLSQSGDSNKNIADFVQYNLKYIDHSEMEKLTKELGVDDILRSGKTNHKDKD